MSARTRQDERICSGGMVEDDSIAAASYHNLPPHSPELANFLAHQQQQQQQQHQQHLLQQQGQAGPLMWPPPAHLGVQFQQQHHPHPHPHAQHHHQPQPQPTQSPHVYNDYLYNLTYSGPPGPPETYSVLPVGHGNFLKVYHCTENAVNDVYAQQAAAAAVNFSHINMASLSQHPSQAQVQVQAQAQAQVQAQAQAQAQATTAQQTPPVQTQLYELFATNPQLPLPEMNNALQQQQQQQQEQQQKQQQPQPQQQPQSPRFHQIDDSAANTTGASSGAAPSNSCNMFINNLVNNWSPNLTDASYVQFTGEAPKSVCNHNEGSPKASATSAPAPAPVVPPQPLSPVKVPQQQQQSEYQAQVLQAKSVETSNKEVNANTTPVAASPPPTKTQSIIAAATSAAATAINKKANIVPGMAEGKKRIVAEVKPMPMSYSDVLSKGSSLRNSSGPSISTSGETRTTNNLENGHATQRRQGKEDGNGNGNGNGNREVRSNAKRSPLHELKDLPGIGGNGMSHRSKKRQQSGNPGISQKQLPLTQQQQQQQQQQTQATIKSNKPSQEKKRPANLKLNSNNNSNVNGYGTKTIDSKATSSNSGNVNSSNAALGSNSSSSSQNFSTRKSNNNNNRHSSNSNSSNTNYSNGNSNNTAGSNSSNSNHHHGSNSGSGGNSNANSSSSKRYSASSNANLSSNSGSYSYSSKRNRSSGYGSSNSPAHSITSNRNYELAKRILHTWWIYTLKLLTWLFYLVYDIVVLGCSMAYERLTTAYVAGVAYARQLHKELKQNSGKPSIWWRNYWRRFDARFKKSSRWAFWRRFYKRKPPEASTEAFKTGRLPQTGEEAMYSLLNCKGKDAYSILGVPPDSPQEQIRKHYKKIAVLVHPDKNKQAGAEEAFKVLQRAFELIGEPENRLAYDQSIAEALHAEKAWTELHDLLSQLQTKMTEAANTIRCSTCAQRHPRKLTERPHYAARECASCKIRHSAKDGDIWAETSMLGLRWKYLALMDGKVYDITEWANCQKGALSHLEPNSHVVQYRIVRGAQQQQQQQQPQQQQHPHQQQPQSHPHHPAGSTAGVSEATLHEFLDNLYSGQHPGAPNSTPFASNARRRARRN